SEDRTAIDRDALVAPGTQLVGRIRAGSAVDALRARTGWPAVSVLDVSAIVLAKPHRAFPVGRALRLRCRQRGIAVARTHRREVREGYAVIREIDSALAARRGAVGIGRAVLVTARVGARAHARVALVALRPDRARRSLVTARGNPTRRRHCQQRVNVARLVRPSPALRHDRARLRREPVAGALSVDPR